jgi:hypothetical protein
MARQYEMPESHKRAFYHLAVASVCDCTPEEVKRRQTHFARVYTDETWKELPLTQKATAIEKWLAEYTESALTVNEITEIVNQYLKDEKPQKSAAIKSH